MPIPLSRRDGKLLKPVSSELRLTHEKLKLFLQAALDKESVGAEARKLLCSAWIKGSDHESKSLSCSELFS